MSKFSTQEGRQPQAASGHNLRGSLTALRLTQPLPRSPSSQPDPRAELQLLQLHAPFVSSKALALKPDPWLLPFPHLLKPDGPEPKPSQQREAALISVQGRLWGPGTEPAMSQEH